MFYILFSLLFCITTQAKNKTEIVYDYIIVGGGISGLYTGYNIQHKHPHASFLIFEKESELGGRTNNQMFGGTEIMQGAHVGRHEKDTLLYDLIKKLNVAHKLVPVDFHYTQDFADTDPQFVMDTTKNLQKKYIARMHEQLENKESFTLPSFKEFATSELGHEEYQDFIHTTGYTDYQKEHAHEVLFHYGMEDNNEGWTSIQLSWDEMHQKLAAHIGKEHIKTQHTVTSLELTHESTHPQFSITVQNKKKTQTYSTKNIIFALPIDVCNKLIQQSPTLNSLINPVTQIQSQNFLRVYGHFKPRVRNILKQYIPKHSIVYSPLHYVIPMNPDKGVYLLACSDNDDANTLRAYCGNNEHNHTFFEQELERAFQMPAGTLHQGLQKTHCFHWEEGTHYMTPPHSDHVLPHYLQERDVKKALHKHKMEMLQKIRNPYPHIFLVGESVSDNRGWVNEALKSVEYILSRL